MSDDRRLFLQAYVAAAGYGEAFGAARDLVERVSHRAAVRECRVRPYPKFDDQFGVWLDLASPAPEAAFEGLLADLAEGWTAEGDEAERFAIWDRRLHGDAALPVLRWLHLNLHVAGDES